MFLLLIDDSLIVLNNYMRGCPSGLRGAAAKQPYELRYFSDEVCVNPAYSWVRIPSLALFIFKIKTIKNLKNNFSKNGIKNL